MINFDIFRLQKKAVVMVSMDTKSYYNIIVHKVATICILRTDIKYNYMKSMFLILSQLKHKIQTGYGVSEKYYKANKSDIPFQGIDQGNTMGLFRWGIISLPLFEIMKKAGFGAKL